MGLEIGMLEQVKSRPSHLQIPDWSKWPVPHCVGGPYMGHVLVNESNNIISMRGDVCLLFGC